MHARAHNPRRILLTADCVGGVWIYALELACALAPSGIEIALATMGRPLTPEQRQQAAGCINVELFESRYKLEWMEEPWKDVMAAGEWLLDLEERLQPDLVHLNGYAHAALPWRAPKVVVAHSCVLSWWRAVHGTDAPPEWNRYREAVRAGLQAADLIIAPSNAMLACLADHYGPFDAACVIPNARTMPRLPYRPREPFILSAGRLWDAAKNVSALARVAPQLPWPIYIAGEDTRPQGQRTKHHNVRLLGPLLPGELWSWMARASIYALPARYEPFGLSVLEAAMAGCPLVLGDIPSLREIWGDAAIFVPPGEPRKLKAALATLIRDPMQRVRLAEQARLSATRYTPEPMRAAYLAAYRSVMPPEPNEPFEVGKPDFSQPATWEPAGAMTKVAA